ncbi:hypothetical protein LWE69_09390 [Paenibacillus sp. UKAQ_18]|nr:hypothetical protein [Paenibacillus sp. UKAQ_18]
MAVSVWITEMYPKHGILAIGDVTINAKRKIMGVQLARQLNRHNYKMIIPKSAGEIDTDLQERIIDTMAHKYEQSSKFYQGCRGSEETILNKHRNYSRFKTTITNRVKREY